MGCTSLETITFPNSLTRIEGSAFESCSLTKIKIPSKLQIIDIRSFRGNKIEAITIDENNNFFQIHDISDPNSHQTIGQYVTTKDNDLDTEMIAGSLAWGQINFNLTNIAERALYGCYGITSVSIPNIKKIPNYIFEDCQYLSNLVIASNLTCIGNGSFKNCYSLKVFNVPNTIEEIGLHAFYGCKFSQINFTNNSHYEWMSKSEKGGWIVAKNQTDKFSCPICLAYGEINLTKTKNILEGAFSYCSSITELNFNNELNSIGDYAFADCINLESITTSWTVKKLKNLNLGTETFRNASEITVNAKNPDGHSHDELLRNYQEIFTTTKTKANKITINVDPDNNILGPVLGGVFGGIIFVGLTSSGFIWIKRKRNKSKKK